MFLFHVAPGLDEHDGRDAEEDNGHVLTENDPGIHLKPAAETRNQKGTKAML